MSQKGWLRREPIEIDRDQPGFVKRIVAVQLDRGYSPSELATVAGLSPDEFTRLYLPGNGAGRHLSAVPT